MLVDISKVALFVGIITPRKRIPLLISKSLRADTVFAEDLSFRAATVFAEDLS